MEVQDRANNRNQSRHKVVENEEMQQNVLQMIILFYFCIVFNAVLVLSNLGLDSNIFKSQL